MRGAIIAAAAILILVAAYFVFDRAVYDMAGDDPGIMAPDEGAGEIRTDPIVTDNPEAGEASAEAPGVGEDTGSAETVAGEGSGSEPAGGVVTEETPPARAASEDATDAATEVARDTGAGAAESAQGDALAAAVEEGAVGAAESFTVDGYDPFNVRNYIENSDMPLETRNDYIARLRDAESDREELGEVLAELRERFELEAGTGDRQ